MKKLQTLALIAGFAFTSMGAFAQKAQNVDLEKSNLHWVGEKLTGKHEGDIKLKEGNIVIDGKQIKGGKFVIDMNSINVTDLQGKGKAGLEGHLKNDDFFATDKFPTATIEFKKVAKVSDNVTRVTADLTIKDITAPVTFDLTTEGKTAKGTVKVDRTVYGVKYGSKNFFEGLGEKAINDDFTVDVTLVF